MLNDILGLSEKQLIGFVLALVRITSLVTVAPILGSKTVPVQVKVFLSLFLTIMLLPMLKTDDSLESLTLVGMLPLTIKESVAGLLLGFTAKFMFESFQFAGRLISTQMGLGMANLVDPDNGVPSTPIGNIYAIVAIILFLLLDGHHWIISALYKSFEVSSVADLDLIKPAAGRQMLLMFNNLLVVGIKLAAPSMATLFLLEVCMGIMARMVPQMNIFFIGLPVRLGAGLFIIIASLPVFYVFFSSLLSNWKQDVNSILTYL
ncbi:MAG: flagellar biosynthetic protein FliR [bacterium]